MGRSAVLALVLALGACDQGGVQFVVSPPTEAGAARVDEVHLYIGTDALGHLPIAPPGFASDPAVRGSAWTRDTDGPVDVVDMADRDVARFTLAPNGVDQVTVIAIGYTRGADSALVPTSFAARFDVTVSTHRIEVWDLPLVPAQVADPLLQAKGRQVQVWGPNPGDATCVHVLDPISDLEPQYRSAFIVTHGDLDCDSYAKGDLTECNDEAFQFETRPSQSTVNCLDQTPIANTAIEGCLFGARDCADGDGANRLSCSVEHPYCAPASLCNACPGDDVRGAFGCAVSAAVEHPELTGSLHCTLLMEVDDLGDHHACAQLIVGLDAFTPPTVTEPMCAAPQRALFHGPRATDGWTPMPSVLGVPVASMDMERCKFMLSVEATAVPAPVPEAEGGLISVELTTQRGIVLPVVFTPKLTVCTADAVSYCTFTPPPAADSIYACAGSPPSL